MIHLIVVTVIVTALCFIGYRYSRTIQQTTQWLLATVLLFGCGFHGHLATHSMSI